MSRHARVGIVCVSAALAAMAAGCRSTRPHAAAPFDPGLHRRALTAIRDVLTQGQTWPKVHAAECLQALGYTDEVYRVFSQELDAHGHEPKYRIGIWRVLARCAPEPQEREKRVQQILAAFLDENGPDRLHAAETLSKLRCALPEEARNTARALAETGEPVLSAMATWLLAVQGPAPAGTRLADLLASTDVDRRRIAAYALRFERGIAETTAARLIGAAESEPLDSPARPYLQSAAFVHAPAGERQQHLEDELLAHLSSGSAPARYEAAMVLAIRGVRKATPLLARLMDSPEPDDRVAGGYGLLCLESAGR